MVIDFHTHLPHYETYTASYTDLLRAEWGDRAEWVPQHYALPENFLQLMDESGVDYAVVMAELAPITTGVCTNEDVAAFCARSPRLLPYASVNPYLTSQPAQELRRLVRDHGFRGLKLYPTYQYFYPNEPMLYPLYATAQELGIPVSVHLGSSVFKGSRIKYGDPISLDDVAVDFPGLPLLMCHCGRPFWYDQAFGLARLHPNLYMEISGLPPHKLLTYFPELERVADKVIFGSDWPGISSMAGNVEAIRSLALSDATKSKILGGNAARLLKLPG